MFFIGIFGIEEKAKEISSQNNKICFQCEALTKQTIIKTYSYFHIFFVPVFKWNVKYYIKSECCNATYLLNESIGKRIENGENVNIADSDLGEALVSREKYCLSCRTALPRNFEYCPRCGSKLQ